jgi:FlgN protein
MSDTAGETGQSSSVRQTHDAGWDELVNALREELQEKGGLLRLVNQETEILYRRDGPEASRVEEQITNQLQLAARCTQSRELILRNTAGNMGLSEDAKTADILGCFPEYVQPLLDALVTEVDRLSARLEERLKQNHNLKDRFFSRTTSAA